jgi:peptidoglycan-associated lipoprotein
MFQKKLLFFTLGFVFLFSGCGQVAPNPSEIETGRNNVSDTTEIAPQTVSIDEGGFGSGETSATTDGATGSYNSSANGFQSVYFPFGEYEVDESQMQRNIDRAKETQGKIKLEGNCDEFGTDEYNYALGLKRAQAVKESLINHGIASGRIFIVSFGESNPVCTVSSDACYLQNRRVDFRLVK